MDSLESKANENYWIRKLGKLDRYGKIRPGNELEQLSVLIHKGDLLSFNKITSENPLAEFILLITIYNFLLYRYFDNEGFVLSNDYRNNGTLLIQSINADKQDELKKYINKTKNEVLDAMKHSPFNKGGVFEKMNINSFSSFAKFGFFYKDIPENELTDINLLFINSPDGCELRMSFLSKLYDISGCQHFLETFVRMVIGIQEYIEIPLCLIDIITESEKEKYYNTNHTSSLVFPEHKTIIQLFEEQVARTPNDLALIFGNQSFSYWELNNKVNQFAYFLDDVFSIEAEDKVGIKLERGIQQIIAILSILKLGSVYVPIRMDWPEERVAFIKKDSNCKVIINESIWKSAIAKLVNYKPDNPNKSFGVDNLAYIMYTSGTTGLPKGVMIEHRSIVHLIAWFTDEFNIDGSTKSIQLTDISFDPSIEDIFATLTNGGLYHIIPEDVLLNVKELQSYIVENEISIINYVPHIIHELLKDIPRIESLKTVISGGEKLSEEIKDQIVSKGYDLYNNYGPTETTVDVLSGKMGSLGVHLGTATGNTQIFVLDKNMNPLPYGIEGELFIGGPGVAKGYLNRPDLTAEKFIDNPFDSQGKLYRSGDIVKRNAHGNIEFVGRRDYQIKLNGLRIELGEIESVLTNSFEEIEQSIVRIRTIGNNKELIAYYKSKNPINELELKESLSSQLPYYMLPRSYAHIIKIPLTSNGKIDFAALSKVEDSPISKRYQAPTTKVEKIIIEIWEEVLELSHIGIEDNFFELGGHSLKVGQVINEIYSKLEKTISFKDFFANPTVKEIVASLKDKKYESIPKASPSDSYPLSSAQKRFWLLSQTEEGTKAYVMPAAIHMEGEVNKIALEKAFLKVMDRHEILRTSFKEERGIIMQFVHPMDDIDFSISIKEVENATDEKIRGELDGICEIPFDLKKAPLMRAGLIKVQQNEYVFYLFMHHIIGDEWSTKLLITEIIAFYNGFLRGAELDLKPLPIQYKDVVFWNQAKETSSTYSDARKYWLEQFEDNIPKLDLPSFRTRPSIQSYNGNTVQWHYSEKFLELLQSFSNAKGVTLFATLMAGVKVLLSRYTQQQDIIIGTPSEGRNHPDLEGQMGLYLNTLAIRSQIEEEFSFSDFVKQEQSVLIKAFENKIFPFEQLISEIKMERDDSRSPLFDILVVLNQEQLRNISSEASFDKISIKHFPIHESTSQFDLVFSFMAYEGLELSLNYNTDIYEQWLIERIFVHLENILTNAIEQESLAIQNIPFLKAREVEQLIHDFNGVGDFPTINDRSIIEIISNQSISTPDNTALVFGYEKLSYSELEKLSNQFAEHITSKYDIQAQDLIGIYLDRGIHQIISIISILKFGGAYVPLDISLPEERVSFIKNDTASKVIIDDNEWNDFLICQKEYSGLPINHKISPNDLAYVMYTSGTTGVPKGVMVEHKNINNLISWFNQKFKIDENTRSIQLTDISFDPSIEDIFGTLSKGGTYHIISKELLLNIPRLQSYLKEQGISILNYVPNVLSELLRDIPKITSIKTIISGGEKLPDSVKKVILSKGYRLYNNYGPTEITVDALCSEIDDGEITLGKPIANAQVYIVDGNQNLLPVGVEGELLVGGNGVARGYLNREALTLEKFIDNPFGEGELYKTGDIAKWMPNGTVKFLGRKDNQVKIRGLRVELGEIESVLLSYPHIEKVIVLLRKINGQNSLVAYLKSDSSLDVNTIKNDLKLHLPAHMIPSAYLEIEKIPFTHNGKIDTRKLLQIPVESQALKTYVAPRNELEESLSNIWKDVLSIEKVGIDDNLFDLGGNSITITQIMNRIYQQKGQHISYSQFFKHPTIKGISEKLSIKDYNEIPLAIKSKSYPLSFLQRRFWILSQLEERALVFNMSASFILNGKIQLDFLESAFLEVIKRHEILRTYFKQVNKEIRQFITPIEQLKFHINIEDGREMKRDEIDILLKNLAGVPFDLEEAPLLKAYCIQESDEKNILYISIHHIVSDGKSIELMMEEVIGNYNTFIEGEEQNKQQLGIQYKDFASWQIDNSIQREYGAAEKYWLGQFSGELSALDLPSFKERPLQQTFNGTTLTHIFSNTFLNKLTALSREHDTTLFTILMAGINLLLSKYSNQKDIIIGTPSSARTHPDLENQIGPYINILPIRTIISDDDNFPQLIEHQKQLLSNAFENQNYPFSELYRQLKLGRDASRSGLFDILLVLQDKVLNNNGLLGLNGVGIEAYPMDNNASQFDISFYFEIINNGLKLSLEYNTDIYDSFLIQRIFQHLEYLYNNIIEDKNLALSQFNYLSSEEENELVSDFNSSSIPYDKSVTFLHLFQEQVSNHKGKIAVHDIKGHYTYEELGELSDKIAHNIISEYGDAKEAIAVILNRSCDMLAILLGILKAGKPYIPIDPTLPLERQQYIIEHSDVKVIIAESEYIINETYDKIAWLNKHVLLDEISTTTTHLNMHVLPEDTAYIIYTSGTTGKPKGVEIGHLSLMNFLLSMQEKPGILPDDLWYAVTTYSFDISILEFFGPLISGATLYLANNETLANPELIIEDLERIQPTIIQATPSFYKMLFLTGWKGNASLKILCGGDSLRAVLGEELLDTNKELWNMYGPTETTIWSSIKKIESPRDTTCIGKPIGNTQILIVDNAMNIVPVGVVGNIYIGGDGLAKGYFLNDELTNQKFIKNPVGKGKVYNVGDVGKWTTLGEILFLGRNDNQVKIRGYRIELEEIETVLNKISEIDEAIVVAQNQNGVKTLVAFLRINTKIGNAEIRTYLKDKLPFYMLPAQFVELKEIPLNHNGKIDRKYLSKLTSFAPLLGTEIIEARNEVEEKLVKIWQDILKIEKISVTDDFFELGGHSLHMMNLKNTIEEEFSITLILKELFANMILENQAVLIENITGLEIITSTLDTEGDIEHFTI